MTGETASSSTRTNTGVDAETPHSARVWNYWLGGKDHYAVDRELGDQVAATWPSIIDHARSSRVFLSRAVRYLVERAGVRQFLDVGTGLPTAQNTHELAQRLAPESRIVYVDNDPLVLTHARALLTSSTEGATDYIDADLYDATGIIDHAAHTLDLNQPVALMVLSTLGHVPTHEQAHSVVRGLMERLPSGSYLAIHDGTNTENTADGANQYNTSGAVPYHLRAPEQIHTWFDSVDLVDPGLVSSSDWHPELSDEQLPPELDTRVGIGRKR